VLDPRASEWRGSSCGGSRCTSIWSGSRTVCFSSMAGAAHRAGAGGHSGQSRLLAECASPQLGHLAGEARQHPSMALRLPLLGQEGLGHRCSDLVCGREHRPVFPTGQAGQASVKPGPACRNSLGSGLAGACRPAGLVNPEPGLAGPTYRPYRLFPGCLIGRPGLYSLGPHIRLRPTHS